MLNHPYRPNTRLLQTAIPREHPVEAMDRTVAGIDEEPLVFHAWTWNELFFTCALTLLFWTAGFQLVKILVPYIVAVLEP